MQASPFSRQYSIHGKYKPHCATHSVSIIVHRSRLVDVADGAGVFVAASDLDGVTLGDADADVVLVGCDGDGDAICSCTCRAAFGFLVLNRAAGSVQYGDTVTVGDADPDVVLICCGGDVNCSCR